MSIAIGKFLIEYKSGSRWEVSYPVSNSRISVPIYDFESIIQHLVDQSFADQQAFCRLFSLAMTGDPDQFIDQYPDFLAYMDPQDDHIDHLNLSRRDKFNQYLAAFLTAFNRIHNTQYHHYDMEHFLTEARKIFENEK